MSHSLMHFNLLTLYETCCADRDIIHTCCCCICPLRDTSQNRVKYCVLPLLHWLNSRSRALKVRAGQMTRM